MIKQVEYSGSMVGWRKGGKKNSLDLIDQLGGQSDKSESFFGDFNVILLPLGKKEVGIFIIKSIVILQIYSTTEASKIWVQ